MEQQVAMSVAEPKRGSDFAGFWTEQNPLGNIPVELPRSPRLEAAGSEETTPKLAEKTPFIAADHGRGSAVALKQETNSATVQFEGSISRLNAAIERVDSILSSRRSAGNDSSRSLCQGSILEKTIKNNPPHVLPQPPGIAKDENHTTRLARLKIRNEPLHRLSREPVLGGSCRQTRSGRGVHLGTAPSSLPTSPCSSSIDFLRAVRSSKESRASKLLRKLKLSGIRSREDTKAGKRSRSSSSSRAFASSQHQMLATSWELRPPESRLHEPELPTIQSEGTNFARSTQSNVPSQEGNGTQPEYPRWRFKWKWGSKTTVAKGKRIVASPREPTANIMSDARASLYTQSDRFASGRGKRGRSSWGCASLASTAVLPQTARLQTPSYDATQTCQSCGSRRIDRAGSQSSRIDRNFLESSFRSVGGRSFRSTGGHSFRSAGGQSFRSIGSGGWQSSVRKDPIFEDCRGSFRSIGSPGSCGSFRSFDSSKRFPSVESEMEWDSRLPPPLQGDQSQTIDMASLCNSSLKFVFKCREIQHFNRFLRTQKKCILRGSETGNTNRFHVILSGPDNGSSVIYRLQCGLMAEVSSMVSAMCYAWFLENTVPKVTGETWHAIPVINMPRYEMHKHKDAAWLFDACGIDAKTLLFADEIEMASLTATGRIKTSAIGQDVLITKNEVGSECTLLGEKLLAEAQCLLEPRYMKTLLLAGILLDTENHDFASKRDTEMTTVLLVGSGSLGRNGFFNQLKGVEDDERVSKFITRNYGEDKQAQRKRHEEADQEQFDKDSLFTPSQDQTSTSEAGTTSSLDEDSPRLKQRISSFKYTKFLAPHSHQLPSPSSAGCNEDEMSVALRRKVATRSASVCGAKSPRLIQKRLFLYQA